MHVVPSGAHKYAPLIRILVQNRANKTSQAFYYRFSITLWPYTSSQVSRSSHLETRHPISQPDSRTKY